MSFLQHNAAALPIFSDALINTLRAVAERRWVVDDKMAKGPIPNRKMLRHLFEVCFLLSLRFDEGRSLSIRLTFLDANFLHDSRYWPSYISSFRFDQPIDCTVDELAKLTQSHDPKTSTFVAAEIRNQLKILGVVQFGPNYSPLARSSRHPPPMGFGLLTRDPGRLNITLGPFLIARFEDGKLKEPDVAVLSPETELGDLFYSTAFGHTWHQANASFRDIWHKTNPSEYANFYVQCVEELLYNMSMRRHGGTILWVPRPLLEKAETYLNIRRRIGGMSHSGADHIARLITSPTDLRQVMLSRLRQYMEFIAQLSCIDGAVVIDDMLQPIGFAVEIVAPTWTGEIRNKSLTDPAQIVLAQYGMRHNSAVRFVAAVPGAIALVLSQDGPARAMRRNEDQIHWWPDCTASVFA